MPLFERAENVTVNDGEFVDSSVYYITHHHHHRHYYQCPWSGQCVPRRDVEGSRGQGSRSADSAQRGMPALARFDDDGRLIELGSTTVELYTIDERSEPDEQVPAEIPGREGVESDEEDDDDDDVHSTWALRQHEARRRRRGAHPQSQSQLDDDDQGSIVNYGLGAVSTIRGTTVEGPGGHSHVHDLGEIQPRDLIYLARIGCFVSQSGLSTAD
ncbi:hypothetical protein CC1G_10987 [Coprinopsis cinerea okayama7|uniref:Uncharacterized protein n=1 Tax=Coprinopsis cinerea (strain Okayama-7 / 130 / ATCC MYA-4618 / FGSC 9003) TaxID=240176 RepID=A8P710_COPC7|nr:hypothetical protein CC1G_10987 [Coprinopsis cinerea okayama7\|eukprot:XP_001839265.2 hypothetical protein CC1G_10987 [Coprinopsis cinerea okayama7\